MEWTTYQLSDVCTIKKRGVTPKEGVCYALYSLPAFDKSKKPEIVYGQEIKSNKFSIQNNTILFNKLNVRFKRVWNIKELKHSNNICSTEFFPLSVKGDVEQDFLYYYLISDHITEILKKSLSGTSSSHQRIDLNLFLQLPINLPSISDQRKIAGILSALDSKIENNNKINANLEAQAEALFKSWFVDFTPFKDQPFVDSELGPIPQGWKVGKLGDICTFKRGKNLLSKNAIDEGVPVVAGGLSPSCYHNQANTSAPVVTVSGSGANAGFMRMYHVDVWASDCSFIDVSCDYLYFVYCFLSVNRRLLKHAQTGAVQPHVKPADIHDFDVVIPEEDIVKAFQSIIKELLTKVGVNEKENQRLAALRDTLLPKLMSGEIKL